MKLSEMSSRNIYKNNLLILNVFFLFSFFFFYSSLLFSFPHIFPQILWEPNIYFTQKSNLEKL